MFDAETSCCKCLSKHLPPQIPGDVACPSTGFFLCPQCSKGQPGVCTLATALAHVCIWICVSVLPRLPLALSRVFKLLSVLVLLGTWDHAVGSNFTSVSLRVKLLQSLEKAKSFQLDRTGRSSSNHLDFKSIHFTDVKTEAHILEVSHPGTPCD